MARASGVRLRRARLGAVVRVSAAVSLLALTSVGSSSPAFAEDSKTVKAAVAGSWYQPNPTCQLATGCLELPLPSAFPAGTVHVGVLLGIEESRTFLAIDIPQGKKLSGGVLTLPVDTALSRLPENARLQACLATGDFHSEDQGATTVSPTPLCTFSAPVKLEAATGPLAVGRTMTVDLAPFLTTWMTERRGILAIVPASDVQLTDTFHVAFSTAGREDPTGLSKPMSAVFTVGSDIEEPEEQPTDSGTDSDPISGGGSFESPVVSEPELGMPQAAPPAKVVAPPLTEPLPQSIATKLVSYPYPGVYLVPLIFTLGLVWATRAFTVDLTRTRR